MGNCDKVTYGYDALGRLVGSESTDGYDTSYAYDLNSSPTAIVRNGLTSDGFSIGIVDDLELRYDGNRLKKVIDLAGAVNIESSLDFVESSDETGDLYDESGRLTVWPGLEGSSIKYAPNDMPVMINSNMGTVGFRYRADGKKLSTATTGISFIPAIKQDTYTQYDIGSFRFCSSRRNPQMVLERVNLPWGYFDSEGMANVYIQDYQGNIRAVYNQDDDCIVQQTDYYPYGLPKATSTEPAINPFKYGGKELNTHLPLPFYDFTARMQLPQLCLFQRPDPKATDYTWLNPFTYCAGDPINYVDKDGCEPVYNTYGYLIGITDTGLRGTPIIVDDSKSGNIDYRKMTSTEIQSINLGVDGLVDEEAKARYEASVAELPNRPDWDGYITLDEANSWWRNGNGQPLFADLEQICFSGVKTLTPKKAGEEEFVNLILYSETVDDGLVYGNIKIKHYPNNKIRAYDDLYDFDMKKWGAPKNIIRNVLTKIGSTVAGNGIPFKIMFYGTKRLVQY